MKLVQETLRTTRRKDIWDEKHPDEFWTTTWHGKRADEEKICVLRITRVHHKKGYAFEVHGTRDEFRFLADRLRKLADAR